MRLFLSLSVRYRHVFALVYIKIVSIFRYRATGVAISMISARLGGIMGNIVIAQLLDLYCPAPTFIVSVLLAGGGLLCLMLPNTTRTALS